MTPRRVTGGAGTSHRSPPGQRNEIALRVPKEGHLFTLAGQSELSRFVDENDVGFRLDLDACVAESLGLGTDVVDMQIQQG